MCGRRELAEPRGDRSRSPARKIAYAAGPALLSSPELSPTVPWDPPALDDRVKQKRLTTPNDVPIEAVSDEERPAGQRRPARQDA